MLLSSGGVGVVGEVCFGAVRRFFFVFVVSEVKRMPAFWCKDAGGVADRWLAGGWIELGDPAAAVVVDGQLRFMLEAAWGAAPADWAFSFG